MGRLIIVSNRLPVSVDWRDGGFHFSSSIGGLATGLRSFYQSRDAVWLGWCDMPRSHSGPDDRAVVRDRLIEEYGCHPVFLNQAEVRDYYSGFSNRTLWPMFHQFPQFTTFDPKTWNVYLRVNRLFCETLEEIAEPDDHIWIQDYHLLLLPSLLRERRPSASIGLFLHIPFPTFEQFRTLPWRREVLEGMLGADLIGFHTYDYMSNFLECATRLEGLDNVFGRIETDDRVVQADVFPMGIDYERFSMGAKTLRTLRQIERIKNRSGQRRIVLSMDRLDYTKGIEERLHAIDAFLSAHPEQVAELEFVLVAAPSRTRVESYRELRRRVDELVGRINGKWGSMEWIPVRYLYQSLPFSQVVALYAASDVALVTPLRDGMNLIAKEYVAANHDGKGVLILSEMAGASIEMGEALVVNPNDQEAIVSALETALEMPEAEQTERLSAMCRRLESYDVERWAREFLDGLDSIKETQRSFEARQLDAEHRSELLTAYRSAKRRLLLLDYDGTLMPFSKRAARLSPDAETLEILGGLARDPRNQVVVLSGRMREQLERWLGPLPIGLIAEHGAWSRSAGAPWGPLDEWRAEWKQQVQPILELYVTRVPGSFIEEKEYSLAWHYRAAEPVSAAARVTELQETLGKLITNLDAAVIPGNKVIEIRTNHIDKGRGARNWLDREDWDFVLEIGDDRTDEDGFAVLPDGAFSIKVGMRPSLADRFVRSVTDVRALLQDLVATGE
jgi:trehalose 6-phosphate synthase/phosphatase